ncbi:hypothetical protein AX17_007136 [Amanita inopinata Kibby_2008]|nr:hypothetical protein AX17_007136 [Amanita inopinata Kibby_2008]
MTVPQTPTRRSKRFQPLATPSAEQRKSLGCTWNGDPIYTRPTELDYDVLPDEKDQYNGDGEYETLFYESFISKCKKARAFRTVKNAHTAAKEISAGAMQTFHMGDTVMVETDTLYRFRRPPSIAVIVSMFETREKTAGADRGKSNKMRIRIHWFLRPSELASIRAKREYLSSEIFYSLSSTEVLFPEVIIAHCSVTSITPSLKTKKGTVKKPPQRSKKTRSLKTLFSEDESDPGTEVEEKSGGIEPFYCHIAVNSMRGLFYELNWEQHHRKALHASTIIPSTMDTHWGTGSDWDAVAQISNKRATLKAMQGRNKTAVKLADVASESDDGGTGDEYHASDAQGEDTADEDELLLVGAAEGDASGEDIADDEPEAEPQTPSKKKRRRGCATTTPRKARRTLVHPTPHSRRVLMAQGSPRKGKLKIPAQPLTYVSYDLSHLPKDPWLRAMHVLHVGSRPDALPCRDEEFRRVLRCVGELLAEGSGGCIYISGVPGTGKTATIHAVIRELKRMAVNNEINPFTYVEINGLRVPEPSAAYNLLWEGVSGRDTAKDGHLRISAKDSLKALTRHFNGGGGRGRGPGGHACVVLMDELDQLVTAKQDVIYNFFNWPTLVGSKLVVIAVANTMDLPERVMTGRVRSRLGMIRINFQPYTTQQLEQIVKSRLASAREGLENGNDKDVIAPDGIKFAAMKVSSISGDARRVLDICRRTVELVQSARKTARTADVKEVIQAMQNSPTAAYLRDCSFHERLMLASLVKCIKREGVDEIKWREIQNQHLIYMNVLPSESDSLRKPTISELTMVLDSLVATRAMLVEDGPAVDRKPDGERRVLLNLEQAEVERVLGEMGGTAWKSVLNS